MDKFQGLGGLFGRLIIYIYIWIAVAIVILAVFIALLAKYFSKKKTGKVENDDRKKLILRICMYVVLGLLIFVLSPLIVAFL